MAISLNPNQFGFLNNDKTQANRQGAGVPAAANAQAQGKVSNNPVANEVLNSERQSAQQTADNMLGFIGRDIDRLRNAGASDARIAERIAAAREGIARGYAEAEAILEDRGLLSDELKQDIAAGRAMIEEGVSRLEAGESLPELQTSQPNLVAAQSSLKVSNQLSLQVLTRDGDRVTVSFAQSEARSAALAPGQLSVSASSQSGWQMSVEGNLDDAEQQALSSLFDSVQDLSERFFGGDLGGALEQAMDLGFDGQELASMSLNLTQQTVATSTRAYSDVQPQLPTEQLETLKAPLASYVDAYLAAIDKASPLAEPEDTLQQLVNQLLPEEERLPVWNNFHKGLETATQLAGLFNDSGKLRQS